MTHLSREYLGELVPRTSSDFIEVSPEIYVMRAFMPAEAAAAVTIAEGSPVWSDAGIYTGSGVDKAVRDAEVLYEELHQPYAAAYRERLTVVSGELARALVPNAIPSEMQIVRYHPSGRFADHKDIPSTGDRRRVLSLVCYLNDEFAGGETTFVDAGVSLQPASGIVVAFRPDVLHRAEPVESGTKYAITALVRRGSLGRPRVVPRGENRRFLSRRARNSLDKVPAEFHLEGGVQRIHRAPESGMVDISKRDPLGFECLYRRIGAGISHVPP